jgi:uncharacterized repeat protein (TIGR02543 family)
MKRKIRFGFLDGLKSAKEKFYVLAFLMLISGGVFGQYSVTGTGIGNTYTQNFNTFSGTVSSLPVNWSASGSQNGTAAYRVLTAGSATPTTAQASGNNFYAGRASSSSSDYSILQKQGTSGSSYFTFNAINNTANSIDGFVLSWNVEQFAVGGRPTTVNLEYSINGGAWATANITGTYIYTSNTGTTATNFSYVNGTPTNFSVSISSISVTNNQTIDFRFAVTNGSGSGSNAVVGIDDFTMYATVSVPTFSVTFNSNGGTGTMSNQTASTSTNLTTNTFTRTGYTFAGWNTLANGSGTAYADGASYPFTASTTLYAQWTPTNNTITFDKNAADATGSTPSQILATATSANLTANGYSRPGYSFGGWATTAGGAAVYGDGALYLMGAVNVTLYAVWITTSPFVTTSGTLSALSTTYGTASGNTTFTISAGNLTGALVVSPPSGFEVSTSSGSGFTTSLDLGSSNRTNTPIYVRLATTTGAGTYNGNITLTTTGVTTVNVATASSIVNPKTLTISGLSATSKTYDGNTSVVTTGTLTYNGLVNSETFAVSGIVTWVFSSKDYAASAISLTRTGSYLAPSSNYTVTQPTLSANINKKALSISSPAIAAKAYNGSAVTGAVTPGTLIGLIGSETLVVSGAGTFDAPNASDAGTGKPATIIYALSNGTNGGLANNYLLANGPAVGDITKATPVFTTATIGLNVGGTYTLPGANIASTSDGTLSYSITAGGFATLSGSTITGVVVGSETLTVTQAASVNYLAGSATVVVSVVLVTYTNGDYRTNPAFVGNISFNTTTASGGIFPWQIWNGSAWTDTTTSPQSLTTKPANIYIVSGANVSVANGGTYNNIFLDNASTTLTYSNTSGLTIEALKTLDIKAGTFNLSGVFELLAGSNLIVRSGATLDISCISNYFSRATSSNFTVENQGIVNIRKYLLDIWRGNEDFAGESLFNIYGWDDAERIISASSVIMTNNVGSKFGYLNIEIGATGISGNWTYLFPSGETFNLTHKDFKITNNSSYNISLNGGTLTVGADFIIGGTGNVQGQAQAGTKTINVKGNFIKNDSGSFRLLVSGGAYVCTLNVDGNFTINAGYFVSDASTTSTAICSVNLKGNLKKSATGYLTNANTNSTNITFNFVGNSTQTVDLFAHINNSDLFRQRFFVKNGAYVQIANQDWKLGTDSKITVETGGTFDFGFFNGLPLNVLINNSQSGTAFTSQTGSILKITSSDGITTGTNLGNVQTTTRSYDQTADFWYIGNQNQVTGNALNTTSTIKNVFVNLSDNTKELRLTNKIGILDGGKLEIQKGILVAEEAGVNDKDFYGTGNLVMSDGEYRISTITATPSTDVLPQLSKYASYLLTGGTVHLNGSNANQVLSGIPIYKKLTFSGANSLGIDDKKISKATQVTDQLYIKETAILNSENKGITGNANVVMDGGRWRISKITSTLPELEGTYSLTGGTIEFYGSITNNNQKFRGGITYNNIDINADFANTNYFNGDEFYNVSPASSFAINGNLNVNSPAVFKISSTHHINGSGNIFINSGATLLYGSEYGIKTSGVATTDGAIRNSGSRTFSNQASYGFIGGQATMATGNGIPSLVENLFIVKSNTTDEVTLSNPNLAIRNKLYMVNGNIATESNTLSIGIDATNKGTLEYTSGFVKGTLKRWFSGTNSGNDTALFPMANATNKNRFAKIEYTNPPSVAGSITAELKTLAMGTSGITALASIPAAGTCASLSITATDETGYWTLTKDAALTGGTFTGSFTKEDATNTTAICEMSLLKRDAIDWTSPGLHLQPSGTPSIVTLSRSGLNSFGDFGFGSKRCTPNIWNGVNWSAGDPTISHKAIFAQNFTTSTSIKVCECEIQADKTLIVSANTTLEIQGSLQNNGILTVESSGSLLQHDDAAVNTGAITVKRLAKPMFRYDYTYWSSPVQNQDLHTLSPATFYDKYFSWNATAAPQVWQAHNRSITGYPSPSVIMGQAIGYIIRAPQSYPIEAVGATPENFTAQFYGVPNNGIITPSIVGGTDKWNLIGNPYPSAISADLFLGDALNTGVVEGTIYFWTHNSSTTVIGTTNVYNPADYAVYNFSGATNTAPSSMGGLPNNNNNTPDGFIAAGQSFFIKGTGGGNATFKNSMRVAGYNNQFFRMASGATETQSEIQKHRIWLNLSNTQGAFNQALVGYIQNATDGYDRGYDGEILGGNSVSFYSVLANKNLTIQGRSLPFNSEDQIPMGYKATTSGNLKIGIDHFDALFDNQNIYIEDTMLNLIHDLKQSDYEFATAIGTFNNRFVLRYTNQTLGTGEFESASNNVIISVKEKNIKVVSQKESIETIQIFDILGRIIYQNNEVHALNFSVSEIAASQQVLIVKLKLENGQKIDKKIIYN